MFLLTKLFQLQDWKLNYWLFFLCHSSKYIYMWCVCVCVYFLFLSVCTICRIHACLHVCGYMSVCRLTCLCVYVDGDWRLMPSLFPSCILCSVSVLYIVAGSLTESQSLQLWVVWLTSLLQGFPVSTLPCWGCRQAAMRTWLLHGFWGYELWTWCLCDKHFICRVIFSSDIFLIYYILNLMPLSSSFQ